MLLVAATALFHRYLFTSVTLPIGDGPALVLNSIGTLEYTAEKVLSGVLPLWNPYAYGGFPHLALGYSGVFYPPNLAYAYGSAATVAKYDVIAHIYLLTAGAYLLGRDTFKFRASALAISGLLLFSTPTALLFLGGQISALHVCAYMPFVVLSIRHILVSPRITWSVLLSLTVAVQVLGGSFRFLFVEAVALSLLMGIDLFRRYIKEWEPTALVLRKVGLLALGTILGLFIGAAQLLPTFELLAVDSGRAGVPASNESVTEMTPAKALDWALEWQNPATNAGSIADTIPFLGPFAIALGVLGLVSGARRHAWSIVLVIVLTVLVSSRIIALSNDYLHKIPLAGLSGIGHDVGIMLAFFMLMLTGLGLDVLFDVQRQRTNPRRALLPLVVALAAILLWPIAGGSDPFQLPFIAASGLFIWLVGLFLTRTRRVLPVALWVAGCLFFDSYRAQAMVPWTAAEPGEYNASEEFLQIADQHTTRERMLLLTRADGEIWEPHPRIGAITNERTLAFYKQSEHDDHGRLWRAIEPVEEALSVKWSLGAGMSGTYQPGEVHPESLPYLDMLNITYIVAPVPGPSLLNVLTNRSPRFLSYVVEDLIIYKNNSSMPIAYILHDVEIAQPEDVFDLLKDRNVNLSKTAIVEKPLESEQFTPPTDTETVSITHYGLREVEMSLRVAAPGLLVLTDTYYPGWRAVINNERARSTLRVNGLLRGVVVEPGDRNVRFRYDPNSLRMGLLLSGAGSIIWLLLAIGFVIRHFVSHRNRSS